jgi:HEAT repeat protein
MRTILMFGPDKAYSAVPDILKELKKHTLGTPVDLSVRISGIVALGAAINGVKEPDPKYQKDAVTILHYFLTKDNQAIVKMRALQTLPRLGPEARGLTNDVVNLVKDPDTWETRQQAVQTLVILVADPKRLPPSHVLDAMYGRLKDASHNVRLSALQGLAVLGTPGELAQKSVMINKMEDLALKDSDPNVRIWAHLAIMTVKQAITNDHLLAIAAMLHNPDVMVRAQAAQALAMAGPKGQPAVPELIKALGDPDVGVVNACLKTLISMDLTPAVLNAVARQLTHEDGSVRLAAAGALAMAGAKGEATAPALISALDDKEQLVVAACMVALASMKYTGAVPILQRIVDDPQRSPELKKTAALAIEQIQKKEMPKEKDKK